MVRKFGKHAEMDLTAFHLDVVNGRAGGRVIWQPRIICWYWDKQFFKEPLPAPYTGMSLRDLYRALGVSNRVYDFGECFVAKEDPAVRFSHREIDATDYETLIETPAGNQRAVYRKSPNNGHHRPIKWPISDEAEMRVAIWREERRTWSWNQKRYEELSAHWAGLGAPTMCIPRTTVQRLYIENMGVEEAIFALADYPDVCKAYFRAMEENMLPLIDVINASPVQVINFGDNLHSSTLSPDLFVEHLLPAYQKRCERLHRAGKFIHSHWDGNCRPLLPYARETGLDGIEAITPEPQGDVTLEETKKALGDMWLLDGIPAVFFDRTFSEKTLVDCAKKCIDLFAPHLILGASDEISSTGDIERIRLVTQVVDEYNAGR